jgi:uncharacterized protein
VSLYDKYEKHFVWIAAAVALALAGLIILIVVRSMPPREFAILTGREGGGYYQAALEYQKIAAENGFNLVIQTTAGSVDNLQLLKAGEASIGFVQGGLAENEDPQVLSTLASVFYEPVWIFYRRDYAREGPLLYLYELEGGTISIGEAGSGANQLTRKLLAANGVDEFNTQFLELPAADAAAGLRDGRIDAAIFVIAPGSATIQSLLRDEGIDLMDVEQVDAYQAQFPYLTSVVLPKGAVDLRGRIPAEDKRLISTVANLIVRRDFHPDLLRLMTIAAVETHDDGGLFERRFQFPNVDYADLPIGKEELAYLERIKSGESTFDNYLPFWAAALIDRYLLFVVPIVLLLLPLLSRSPAVYTAYNRYKVNRWYRNVRRMDFHVPQMDKAEIETSLAELDNIDKQMQERVRVSPFYMRDFYDLRGHIDLMQSRLRKRLAQLEEPTTDAPAET